MFVLKRLVEPKTCNPGQTFVLGAEVSYEDGKVDSDPTTFQSVLPLIMDMHYLCFVHVFGAVGQVGRNLPPPPRWSARMNIYPQRDAD